MKASELIRQVLNLQTKLDNDPEIVMVDSDQILIAKLAKGDKVVLESITLPIGEQQKKPKKRAKLPWKRKWDEESE